MQPLTAKELELVVKAMSKEDELIRQCMRTAVHAWNPQVQGACVQLAMRHQQHYQYLLGLLRKHPHDLPLPPEEDLLQAALADQKSAARDYAAAVTEAEGEGVRKMFGELLQESLDMQAELGELMRQPDASAAVPAVPHYERTGQEIRAFMRRQMESLYPGLIFTP